jgi:hypothetical protein
VLEKLYEQHSVRHASFTKQDETVRDTGGAGSVSPLSHPKRIRDASHLQFVTSLPCLVCEGTPSQAHHLKFAQLRALASKSRDEWTVPLCLLHHRALHDVGAKRLGGKSAGLMRRPRRNGCGIKRRAAGLMKLTSERAPNRTMTTRRQTETNRRTAADLERRADAASRQTCFRQPAEQPLRQRTFFRPSTVELPARILEHLHKIAPLSIASKPRARLAPRRAAALRRPSASRSPGNKHRRQTPCGEIVHSRRHCASGNALRSSARRLRVRLSCGEMAQDASFGRPRAKIVRSARSRNCRLASDEFMRRFLQHVLPKGIRNRACAEVRLSLDRAPVVWGPRKIFYNHREPLVASDRIGAP